jgi:hypothetical protein
MHVQETYCHTVLLPAIQRVSEPDPLVCVGRVKGWQAPISEHAITPCTQENMFQGLVAGTPVYQTQGVTKIGLVKSQGFPPQ